MQRSILRQYHYLYKITNLINNKIYIGVHSTNRLNDGYLGSGKAINKAIKKYRKENFRKDILEWFDWKIEALQRESEIVNAEFINRIDNYNLIVGGSCGILCNDIIEIIRSKLIGRKHSVEHIHNTSESLKGRTLSNEHKIKISIGNKGKIMSLESKDKISMKNTGHEVSQHVRDAVSKANTGRASWNKGTKGVCKAPNKGIKHTDATKEHMRNNSKNIKKCNMNGVIFNSVKIAFDTYNHGINSYSTFCSYLRRGKIDNCFLILGV